MKKNLVSLIFLVSVQFAYAQTDLRKGYIITHDNDTIYGQINYSEGAKNFNSCYFIKSNETNEKLYRPGDIKGYRFLNDKFFESRIIINKDKSQDSVFLETLVSGEATLYRLKQTFYIEKGDSVFYKLFSERKEIIVDDKRVSQESNNYKRILNYLLFDCEKTRSTVGRANLTEKDLVPLIEAYNTCNDTTSITYKSDKPWLKSEVGLMGGMNTSKIKFSGGVNQDHLTNADFEKSKSALVGLSLDFFSPRINERISFHVDIFYLNSLYSSFTKFNDGSLTRRNDVVIELENLKIPFGFKYTFIGKKLIPYFNLGASSTFHLSSSAEWIKETEYQQKVETYEQEPFSTTKTQFGWWAGFGFIKPIGSKVKGFIELRYENTNGVTDISFLNAALKSDIQNWQFLLGIKF